MSQFAPSPYQQAIFDFIAGPGGDLICNAVAGSGKTTTLVQAAGRLPFATRQSAVFLAFNRHIAEELSERLPLGVQSSTIHSIGWRALRKHLGCSPKVDGDKYRRLVADYCKAVVPDGAERTEQDVVDSLNEVLRFSMMTMTDCRDEEAVAAMCAHFGIEVPEFGYVFRALPVILNRGLEMRREVVSFDDQICLCVKLDVSMPRFAIQFVDEAQDLNAVQLELILRMRAPGGRVVFVGDRRQAIYGFAGADARSFESIKTRTGATELPLSICYRCPTSHLDMARRIVPEIEAAPDARTGVVMSLPREQVGSFVRAGDLFLCRTNAPLLRMAFELIAQGIGARVKGRDIGASLVKLVDTVAKTPGFHWADFPRRLIEYETRMVNAYSTQENAEMRIASLCDRVECVRTIYEAKTGEGALLCLGDLRAAIDAIFSDGNATVLLSSVHKAKGLENDRILILDREKMPHPMARREWEVEQEYNLLYVALTRAKSELYFVVDFVPEPPKQEAMDFGDGHPAQ